MTPRHDPQPRVPTTDPGFTVPPIPDWANKLLELGRRNGPIPIYGSPDWHALEPADPRRFAAAVAAAECWRQDGLDHNIAQRLTQELYDADTLLRARLRLASWDVADTTDWTAGFRPSHTELARRRQEVT